MALSDFQQLRKLGDGTQGEVFEVVHVPSGRHLALKLFHAADGAGSVPGPRSGEIPPHPRLLLPISAGKDAAGRVWQTFPLVNPENAHALVERDGPAVALSLLTQAAAGLAHIHGNGFVMADLKPDNLLVEPTGRADLWNSYRLTIADLDLARPVNATVGSLSGTRGYLAPELFDGESSVSRRSDIFALGAWLVWVISGREPFVGELRQRHLEQLARDEGRNPTARHDSRFAGSFWGHVLTRMLDPDPLSRIQDGGELLEFLSIQASNDLDWSLAAPGLIRNPRSDSPMDVSLRNQIRSSWHGAAHWDVVTIRYDRVDHVDQFIHDIIADLQWDDAPPLFVNSGTSHEALLVKLGAESNGLIVVDAIRSRGWSSLEPIGEFLELIQLARRGSIERPRPVILLIQPGPELGHLGLNRFGWNQIEFRATAASDKEMSEWMTRTFSSRPFHEPSLQRIIDVGVMTPAGIDALFRMAEAANGLQLISGTIALTESKADELVAELVILRSQSHLLSADAGTLHELLSGIPGGLDPAWLSVNPINVRWVAAADQLGSMGLVRNTQLAIKKNRMEAGEFHQPISEEGRLDRLKNLLAVLADSVGREGEEADSSVIAIRFLANGADHRWYRRGRALARILTRNGKYRQAYRLLELRRNIHPTNQPSVASIMDMMIEADARMRADVAESARVLYRRAGSEARTIAPSWLSIRVTLAWGIAEFEHGHRATTARLLEECLEFLSDRSHLIPRQLRISVSLLIVRMRATGPTDPLLDDHFGMISEGVNVPSPIVAVALSQWGRRMFAQGKGLEARSCFARAMKIIRHKRQAELIGAVTIPVAAHHFVRGYLSRTERLLNRVSALPAGQLAPSDRIACLSGAGALAYERGRIRRAYDVNVQLYELAKRQGHDVLLASAMLNLGLLLHLMNHFADSRHYFGESIRLSRATGTRKWEMATIHLADGELEIGRLNEAILLLRDLENSRPVKERDLVSAFSCRILGRIAANVGAFDDARARLYEAEQTFEDLNAADERLMTQLDLLMLDTEVLPVGVMTEKLDLLSSAADGLGSWRIGAMVRLARLRIRKGLPDPDFEAGARTLIADSLDRGFVTLEIAALDVLVDRLITAGWMHEAQDALKAALTRIRSAADEFADPELRRSYLDSPGRQRFKELSNRIRQGGH